MSKALVVEHHGSIVLLRPLSDNARNWLEQHTEGTWCGGALVVEPRYVEDLLSGLAEESLPLEQTNR